MVVQIVAELARCQPYIKRAHCLPASLNRFCETDTQ